METANRIATTALNAVGQLYQLRSTKNREPVEEEKFEYARTLSTLFTHSSKVCKNAVVLLNHFSK